MNTSISPKRSRTKKILLTGIIILVVLTLATLVTIPHLIMPMFLGQRYEQRQYDSTDFNIESEPIRLITDDSLSLAAWRTRAEDPQGTVIILSGIQNPSVTAFFGYAKTLADNGWNSLLIEMRARSKSEGDEIGFGMTEWLDVKAGVDYLINDPEAKNLPIVAMGTSMGAGTVIIAAGELEEIDAVISISGFATWANLFAHHMTAAGIPKVISTLEMPFLNAYLGFHFGFDALQYTPLKGIAKLGNRPILMMHSTEDDQVPYSEFEILLAEANKHDINANIFIRTGNEHMICYEEYFNDPIQDSVFSNTILSFLAQI